MGTAVSHHGHMTTPALPLRTLLHRRPRTRLLLAVPIRFLRRPAERPALSRLLVINTAGTLFLASFSGLLAIPYFRVPDSGPAGTEIAGQPVALIRYAERIHDR